MIHTPPIFCAIDTPDFDKAVALACEVAPVTGGIKLGLEFFHGCGTAGVSGVMAAAQALAPQTALFLDLKFHDIPNTVAGALGVVSRALHPLYITLHASGGAEMMRAARAACAPETRLLAVSILTSLGDDAFAQVGYTGSVSDQVVRLALLARDSGMDGVVCSPHEVAALRAACGRDFILMVPGIRPEGDAANDQSRIMTPRAAAVQGASHLVIGRPITGAPDPAHAAQDILRSMAVSA